MTPKVLGILGSGPFARLIRDLAVESGFSGKFCYFDDFANLDSEIVGRLEDSPRFFKEGKVDSLAIAIGYRHFELRQKLFDLFNDPECFPNFIHPRAYVSPRASLGNGNYIFSQANVESGARLSHNVSVFNQSSITHDVHVGDHSFLSVGVAMGGRVKIGKRCFVGINATLVNDIQIGDDSLVCAATFLSQSIPANTCVIGNPFKVIDRIEFKG